MKVIHKFPISRDMFDSEGNFEIEVPRGSRIIMVASQRGEDHFPTLWIEDSQEEIQQTFKLRVVGTGREIPKSYGHVGSALCRWGQLVWHVYRRMSAAEMLQC